MGLRVASPIQDAPDGTEVDYRSLYLRAQRRVERERHARLEAEAIAERGLRELYERGRQQALLEAVAVHANGTSSRDEALRFALMEICRHAGLVCGLVYIPSAESGSDLVVSSISHSESESLTPFLEASRGMRFSRETGLPGRVFKTGQPAWIEDLGSDVGFARKAEAAQCVLRSGFAFPIMVAGDVVSVVEFFSRETLSCDEAFLAILRQIGTQLGRVIERERAEERLIHDATHDGLTRLPNRVLFTERLERATIRTGLASGVDLAVLFIDLDRFKLVNDSLGHHAGDELLVEISRRFCGAIADPQRMHTLARLGGDEFTILLEDVDSVEALAIAERLLATLDAPIMVEGRPLHASASIGVVSSSSGYSRAADIMRDADLAMYRAKSQGRSRIAVFDASLHQKAVTRLSLENDLRQALHDSQFTLHYQPIFALDGQRLSGFEALLRWRKPSGEMVAPGDFIAVAEETGLIVFIGAWVFRTACVSAAKWNAGRSMENYLTVSVNVSSRQFQQLDFVSGIRAAIADTGVDPRAIRIEITESVAIENTDRAVAILTELRALGIRISLDDFGTGYSSLSYVHNLPFDTLKIDRSFVQAMGEGEASGRRIIPTILDLARNLKLDVVAEGTETAEEIDILGRMGCDYAQGYFFSKPVEEAAIDRLISG